MFAGADDAKQEYGNLRDLVRRFQAGLFDMVAIGRGMYADPLWVKKVGSGRFSELVPWRKGLLDHLNLEPSVVEAAHVSDERR
jgi:2,4-dienoyl-CoA reductase-like NADH-dependent reductase (Old Yellow Enzyme family)